MRIVVTGGRDFLYPQFVKYILDSLNPTYVFVGDCPTGVDKIVSDWCNDNKVDHKIFVADWDKFGKHAGPLRNREMLEHADDAVVVAFPGGRGTENCAKTAKELGMIILRVE